MLLLKMFALCFLTNCFHTLYENAGSELMLISLLETEVFRIQMFYTGQKTKGDIFQQLYFSSTVLHKVVIKHSDISSSLNEEKNVRISSVSEVGNQCEILIVL